MADVPIFVPTSSTMPSLNDPEVVEEIRRRRAEEEHRRAEQAALVQARLNERYGPKPEEIPVETSPTQTTPAVGVPAGVAATGELGGAHETRARGYEDQLLETKSTWKPNVEHELTKEYTRAVREQNAERPGIQGEGSEAQIGQERAYAQGVDELADKMQERRIDDMARRLSYEEQLAKAQDKADKIGKAHDDAVKQLMSAPDIDPDRYWTNKGAFARVGAALSSALLGFAGMDPFGHIQRAVQEDIDAQKSNLAKRREGINARMEQLRGQQGTYGQILATVENERAADSIARVAYLEEAKTRLEAMHRKHGLPVMSAQAKDLALKLDRAITEEKKVLDTIDVHNLPGTTHRRYVVQGRGKEYLEDRRKRELEGRDKAEAAGVGMISKAEEERVKAEGRKSGGGLDANQFATHSAHFEKELRPHISQIRRIDPLLSETAGDIPGYGPLPIGMEPTKWQEEGQKFKRRLFVEFQAYRTAVTGAGASEGELQRIEEGILSGKSEDDIRDALHLWRDIAAKQAESIQAGFPEEVVSDYYSKLKHPRIRSSEGAIKKSGPASFQE